MTTPAPTLASHPTAPADPYHYGWRYVRHEAPDGMVTFDQVPLTLEDVLYPVRDARGDTKKQ